jgi:hypothetical protein
VKLYRYRGIYLLATGVSRVAGTLLSIVGLAAGTLTVGTYFHDRSATGVLCFGLLWCIVAVIGGTFFVYAYPEIEVDNQGIRLRVWPYPSVRVPWNALGTLHEGRLVKRNVVFVRFYRNLPLHFLYGAYFIRRPVPGFMIRREIDGYSELILTLRAKAP